MAECGHRAILFAVLLISLLAERAGAAQWTAGAGYDYQVGPNGLTWKAPLVLGAWADEQVDAALALYRYHSSDTGWGWSGLVNVGLLSSSGAGGRLIGNWAMGDGDYRAWRLQGGPTFRLGEERSLFLYLTHFEDNQSARLNQIGAEAGIPLGPAFSGLAGAALGKWQGNVSSAQGILGLAWSRWAALQVFGQVMFGEHIASASTLSGGAANGPLGTGGHGHMAGRSGETTSSAEAAAFTGIRVMLP